MSLPPREAAGGSAPSRAFLEDLYRAERRGLFGFFWARLGDREEALDLVQEVFERAWRHLDRVRALPADRRRAWLFACARRLAVDRYRHRAAVRRAEPDIQTASAALAARGQRDGIPGARAERAEDVRRLDAAVRALPAPERDALALMVLGGMNSRQAGSALGLPPGTVRYHLLRARRRLREALAGDAAGKGVAGDGTAAGPRGPGRGA